MTCIVCIGDSIVEGEGDESGKSGWVGRLQQQMLKKTQVGENRVYNLGVGMETSMDLRHRLYSEVLYREPDVIILQSAHGDSRSMVNLAGKEEFEVGKGARLRVYNRMLDYLANSGKKVLILGLNPISQKTKFKKSAPQRAQHIESYNKGMKQLCEDYGLPFLDPRDIFKEHKLEDLYRDGLHPNSKGYDLMFEKIYKKLQELEYV